MLGAVVLEECGYRKLAEHRPRFQDSSRSRRHPTAANQDVLGRPFSASFCKPFTPPADNLTQSLHKHTALRAVYGPVRPYIKPEERTDYEIEDQEEDRREPGKTGRQSRQRLI